VDALAHALDFVLGKRGRGVKDGDGVVAIGSVDAVEHKSMKVNVEGEGRAEALREIDGTRVGLGWMGEWGRCCARCEVPGLVGAARVGSEDGT